MELLIGIVILAQTAMNLILVRWIIRNSSSFRKPKAEENPKKAMATFGGVPFGAKK